MHPVGSAGDVYPFIGLGLALKSRGHKVTVMTSGYFQDVVQQSGLEFVDTLPKDDFLKLAQNPHLWNPIKGVRTIFHSMTIPVLRRCVNDIKNHYIPGDTVLIAPCIGFAGKIAHELIGVPLITVALQPAILWSRFQSPVLTGILQKAPAWFKQFQYNVAERFFLNPHIVPTVNQLRAEFGLNRISRITKWWLSDRCILCLFPEWYAPRQPDWPSQIHYGHFPLWNENQSNALPIEIQDYLDAGDPPIVFTPGSANMHGKKFFATAVDACQKLGCRAMLFSQFPEQIPKRLPDQIGYFRYAPFSELLPHCAAICHHGGIGTMSNALASGIPQLIMPYAYDQYDNAARIKRLGVGDQINRRNFHINHLVKKTERLLTNKKIASNCKKRSEKINSSEPFKSACEIAESMLYS